MVKMTVKTAALALLIVLAYLSPALAGVVGKFTAIDGRVDVLRPGEKRASPVSVGDGVSEGDVVRTKSGSFAEIKFTDDTVLKLTQSTRVEIKEYLLTGNKRQNGALRLLRGKVRATVSKGLGRVIPVIYSGPSTFRIETPTAVAGVKGTDFFVSYNMGSTGVFVLEGAVDTMGLDTPGHVVRVRGGEYSIVEHNRPATEAVSARSFVISRHLKDAEPYEHAKDDHRNRKDLVENGRESRLTDEKRDGNDREGKDLRYYERVSDRSERDFGDFDKDRERDLTDYDGYGERDSDHYDVDRYEHGQHDSDYDRPISEINTALLSTYFKGAVATTTDTVNISADINGKFKDDFTWWAELEGLFSNGQAGDNFRGTVSGSTSSGTFSGTITNGIWEADKWSADVSGTLPGGTFTGTLSGTHDASSNGDIDGKGSGTWTTSGPAVN